MNINTELYKVFYYVAKNESITGGANELMISQPAVSKSIKLLEGQLNTILFNRKNNGVSLTNAGETIYYKIKKAMELITSAEEDIKNLNNMETGNINIGAGNTIIAKYLMPYINEFHKKYPKINIKVNTLVTSELLKMQQIGLIDIVFTHFPYNIPTNFECVKLKKLHDVLVVNSSSKYLSKTISKDDLTKLPLILLPYGASNRKSFDNYCVNNNIVINPLMEVGSESIIEECSQSGLGVGLITKEYALEKLNNKELFELKMNFKFDEKDLGYVIDPIKKNSIIIKNFINLLK